MRNAALSPAFLLSGNFSYKIYLEIAVRYFPGGPQILGAVNSQFGSWSTQDLTQNNFTIFVLKMLPSPSFQSAFVQMKQPEWSLTRQGRSQSQPQSAKLYWSQWAEVPWLRYRPLISNKYIIYTFGTIKCNKAVKFPFPSWIGLWRLVMDGSSPDLSASRGRKEGSPLVLWLGIITWKAACDALGSINLECSATFFLR